jgi:alkylhydroperoxidase family enzyme
MARVSLIDPDNRPDLGELVDRIRSGRRGNVINVYRMLLHSPPLAATWYDHLNAVRWKTTLEGRLRELVIIRIGILNRAAYILRQHVPKLALADGVTQAECDALADWRNSDLFSERERAALAYADEMTRDIAVSDDVFDGLRRHFDERAIVELTVMIGTYNMHSRVVEALRVDLEANP